MGITVKKATVSPEEAERLTKLCPCGAIEYNDGKISINSACKSCKLCVKRDKDGIVEWLGRENLSKGVQIRNVGDMLDVDLFIIVEYGISIAEVCKAIGEQVRYKLESMTGVKVRRVNIAVEGVRI